MSAIEQKIVALFNPLPISIKAKIVALLSKLLAEETASEDTQFLSEDLRTSEEIRRQIDSGKMKTLSEDEYWDQLTAHKG
ncbi:MAG: hypothetical protein AAF206_12400 [Bacteroidota bacterium]